MYDVFLQQSDNLIKQGEYLKATHVLKTLWKSKKENKIANDIIHCMTKLSYWREGDAWVKTFTNHFSKDPTLSKTIEQFIAEKTIANQIQKVNMDSLSEDTLNNLDKIDDPLRRNDLINHAIFRAKKSKKWQVAYDLSVKIDSASLERKSKNSTISELQKYYLNAQDIYPELNKFDQLYSIMKQATTDYPEYFSFTKSFTSTLIQLEKYDEATDYLNKMIIWEKPKWYLVEQLAICLFNQGKKEEGWKLACRSFNTKIDHKHKTHLHLIMIEISTDLGMLELAKDLGILTVLIRVENKETIPQNLFELIKDADPKLTVELLLKRLHDAVQDGIHYGLERVEGIITYFPLNQKFARLRYNKKKTALINKVDLDQDCHYEGAKITFVLKEFTDKTGKHTAVGKYGRKLHKLETV